MSFGDTLFGSQRMRRRVGGLALLVSALIAVTVGAAASRATGQEKPTLTIGGPLECTFGPPGNNFDISYHFVYEPLVKRTPSGKFVPDLATGWKITPDNRTITLTLRKGVRFSDGSRFDANAVKTWFTFLEGKSPNAASLFVNSTAIALGKLTSMKVLSPYSIRLVLDKPNPAVLWALAGTYPSFRTGKVASPKGVANAAAHPKSNPFNQNTYGAGPYVLDPKQSVNNDHCTYVPNKYYYAPGKIKWGKIVTRYISSSTTELSALRAGQIDVDMWADWRNANSASSSGYQVLKGLGVLWYMSFLDHGGLNPALGNVKVRQALNYAIDRKTISKSLLGPYTIPTSSPDFGLDGDSPAASNYYSYNPAKAKALLAQAGHPGGKGIAPIKLVAYGPWQGSLNTQPSCEAVAANWAAIGVHATCTAPPAAAFSKAVNSHTYSGFMANDDTYPAWYWYQTYMVAGAYSADQHGTGDPAVTRLFNKAVAAKGAAQTRLFKQMILQAVKDGWHAPVGYQRGITFVSKKVGGVVAARPNGGDGNPVNDPSEWYPTGK
jgi:peptide/nickel transport system substrate-binding protein